MESIFTSEYLLSRELEAPMQDWTSYQNALHAGILAKSEGAGPKLNGSPSGQRKRKRTLYSKWQQLELESVFSMVPYPDISTREQLAKIIRLPESKVQVWFQNRRARKNKSGKLDRSLYRRGSSVRHSHLSLHSQSPPLNYSQRDPLITMQCPLNKPVQQGSEGHIPISMKQPLFNQHPELSPPHSQQYTGMEEKEQHTHGQRVFHWENMAENSNSSGYEPMLYNMPFVELEKYMSCSPMSYLEMFPQAMNESGSPTTLGCISDLIYNAAILTNVNDF
ncbi:homeobox protein SEBOX [Xenopus laevis]|uniref:Homeobox domain-containing protein n=2 Tax=Xenopus laevis TaxID=8355 RepID=A0A974HXQ4_XENLA|nr:homeobox protein SEBOX [Xenopus laevis]OCT94053.1 hypothetical protein XELAEV_18011716mg [Xenopus laevis]